MTCALLMSSFDLPSHSISGFLLRYIAPRVEPFQLYGPIARRPFFTAIAPAADVIIADGHGEQDEFSAQGESLIWKTGNYNIREVQGKVIKLISCQAGVVLGPDLVQNGARCFMGYDDDIIWLADSSYSPQPWNDPYAQACLMPIIDSLQALLDGQSCGEAMAIERNGYFNNGQLTDSPFLRSCLDFNQQHTVIIGDSNATIKPRHRFYTPIPPPPLLF